MIGPSAMSSGYRVSPGADGDLIQIWEYIAQEDPDAAARLLGRFVNCFAMLARQPLIGTARDDLRRGVRDFSVGSYVIYYRPTSSADVAVEIVRVLHSARDASRLF
jgi:toxin ParE1/3/4